MTWHAVKAAATHNWITSAQRMQDYAKDFAYRKKRPKLQLQSGVALDVVVGQGAIILQRLLLVGDDEELLLNWNALLFPDLGLDVADSNHVSAFGPKLELDGTFGQGLDVDTDKAGRGGGFAADWPSGWAAVSTTCCTCICRVTRATRSRCL